ncbi:MAG TPA: STAS-like domain-containing protein [Blastocatellia bacterium]|nr:STAS-like domain-containing protein [Blastocatellia bacterium]
MKVIKLQPGIAGFAEDKDQAKSIRKAQLLPALERGERIVLDFRDVKYATQSFIHALLGEALYKYQEELLDRVEFKNCTLQLQSVIELVVDYSLGGFPTESQPVAQ